MPVYTYQSISQTISLMKTLLNIPRTCVQKTRGIFAIVLLLLICTFLQEIGGVYICTYSFRHLQDYFFGQNYL